MRLPAKEIPSVIVSFDLSEKKRMSANFKFVIPESEGLFVEAAIAGDGIAHMVSRASEPFIGRGATAKARCAMESAVTEALFNEYQKATLMFDSSDGSYHLEEPKK